MRARPHDTLVIGAGPTGLAAAWRLARAGHDVVVVDAGPEPGGLCRTLTWGDLRFDIGGHRFHTSFPDVEAMVLEVAGDELLEVARKSRIHLGGQRFLGFPPTVGDTLAKVPGVGIRAGLHAAWSAFAGVDPEPPGDLREYLRRQFGDALYGLVFEEYTARVWGLRPEQISPDWGAARVGGLSLSGLLRQALGVGRSGARSVETFRYPADGYGRIFLRQAEDIEQRGGQVRCGHRVVGIETPDAGPVIVRCSTPDGGVVLHARRVLSTMPLAPMAQLLDPPLSPDARGATDALRYRALALVVLDLDGDDPISDDTWLYFPHASTPFCRLHEPTNWSQALAPPGRSHVVVEYFCDVGDDLWQAPDDALSAQVVDGLAAAGLLEPARVRAHQVLRFARAYPIYDGAYADTLARVEEELDARPGLLRAGRSGAFLYLSSDECMRHGLVAAERILAEGSVQQPGRIGEDLVLVCATSVEARPEAVALLARALDRRAADVASGTLAPTDGRALLVRTDQLLAPERLAWPGLALVRRHAWLAAGGDGIDPCSPAAADVLARISADPSRVLVREPRAQAQPREGWWSSLPPGGRRWPALGTGRPHLRRRLASTALWAGLTGGGLAAAACTGPAASWGGPTGLLILSAAAWVLASLPDLMTLLRTRRVGDLAAVLGRALRWG